MCTKMNKIQLIKTTWLNFSEQPQAISVDAMQKKENYIYLSG